ncbi:MAG TPA: hypothetical protein V6C97_09600 [Oculatellaceae cyanobacterium]
MRQTELSDTTMGTASKIHPDSYYEDASIAAIEQALSECADKTPAETRHAIRRAYPFCDGDRRGHEYKVWNRVIHEYEDRLGLPKQQKRTSPKISEKSEKSLSCLSSRITNQVKVVELNQTRQEFLAQYSSPVTQEDAATFLRTHCATGIFLHADHDVLRVGLKLRDADDNKVIWQYTAELRTDDQQEWSRVYVEAAQKAYDQWIDIMLEKLKVRGK